MNSNSKEKKSEKKLFLSQYDFQLKDWYPDFISSSPPPAFKNVQHRIVHSSVVDTAKFLIWRLLSRLCVDTFGLRMMYPGVIIQNLIGKALIDNRSKFIEHKKAQRNLIQTSDSSRNKIDTLFIDQRNVIRYSASSNVVNLFDTFNNSNESNGNYLVICCDGNASFYEIGIFQIPVDCGYSTLGWNYPGFGQSTGLPYPEHVTAAADAVMQYAFSLGFKTENIILFSWSIGGFAVSWLASQYPEVKAVIMDACFDDITPLAQQQMPKFATNFVEYAIRHNLNLHVAQLISNYTGPLMFIRRTQDEIISTIAREPSTNRGNDLLVSTLSKRFPFIVDNDTIPYIRTYLSAKSETDRAKLFTSYCSDLRQCESVLANYLKENSSKFPINLGNSKNDKKFSIDLKLTLALYLCEKYLLNFESTHCQPLPKEFFKLPWSESDILIKSF